MTFKQDYSKYLQSKHWKDLAEETRRLAGYRCQVCNSDQRLEIHHRTYERKGDEYQSDLVCLCHECHEKHHKMNPKDYVIIHKTRLIEFILLKSKQFYTLQNSAEHLTEKDKCLWEKFMAEFVSGDSMHITDKTLELFMDLENSINSDNGENYGTR